MGPIRHSGAAAILTGGLVAGTIDIGAAALINFANPILILKFVAGGLLGKPALSGGPEIAFLGLVLQWVMSLIIAALYVVAAGKLPMLRTRWIACGLAYGVVTFFVMNYVVVPLSAWGKAPTFTVEKFVENMLAMVLFGLIVAYFARSSAKETQPRPGTV